MAIWAMIPAIAGMAGQAAGGQQAAAATVEGAQTQADIEAMNREFQKKLFEEELARQQPYYQAGTERGLPLLQQYMSQGQADLSDMPLYNWQMGAGEQALSAEGMDNPFVRQYLQENIGAAEQDATYQRLNDLLKIGMGASSSAGSGAANFATGQASSLMNAGNALAAGTLGAGNIRQSAYGNLAGQIGSIPAYMQYQQSSRDYRNALQTPQLSGPSLPAGGVR